MTTTTAPHTSSWLPSWPMVTTKFFELRKRVGIMITAVILVVGLPVIVFGIRLIVHAANSSSTGPAGSPGVFQSVCQIMAGFGFIAAAVLGASAGTSDLSEGMFRHLVITGRSRVALYLARIPAAIAIMTSLLAVGFLVVCLVTSFAGTTNPTTLSLDGGTVTMPVNLNEPGLAQYMYDNQEMIGNLLNVGLPPTNGQPYTQAQVDRIARQYYGTYEQTVATTLNPPINEMIKTGLWLELYLVLGCVVGLGLGSLIGQRTVSTILLIVLQIIITPIAAAAVIPDFIDGQRLIVGVAMDQLRPLVMSSVAIGGGGRHPGSLNAPAVTGMAHWFMILVIVGWLVGWTVIGAWRMNTRDA